MKKFTLAEITIKIKAPENWPDNKSDVQYSYMTEKIKQIYRYAKSIDLGDPELSMHFESSELTARETSE